MTTSPKGHHYNNSTVRDNAKAHFGDVYNTYNDSTQRESAETKCSRALYVTDPAVDRQRLIDRKGERVADTCEWLLRDETYQTWLRDESSLLWIRGGPGKGKTMLSIFLTQTLEHEYPGNVIYFFCNSLDKDHSTSTAILRTLIWQVVSQRPKLAALIVPYFDSPERTRAILSTPGTLLELLLDLLKHADVPSMYCLLDGFDECESDSIQWLATHLAKIPQQSGQTGQNHIHITIVSRDLPDLGHVKQRILIDPENNDQVNADIETFTSVKMQTLSQRLNLSDEFVLRTQSELLQKAGATFLWIGYVVNELLTKTTAMEVQESVANVPVALNFLYGRMLHNIPLEKTEVVASILSWVVLAAEPLTLLELAAATGWHVPNHLGRDQAAHDYMSLCRPLVSVQGGKAVLVHQSVKDYLLRPTKDDDPVLERFRIDISDAQLSLTETCLKHISADSALTEYAVSRWFQHARQCGKNARLLITRNNYFFGKGSLMRMQWWKRYHGEGSVSPNNMPRLHMACFLGLLEWAKMLHSSKWRSLKPWRRSIRPAKSSLLPTPLYLAVAGEHIDLVEYLLLQGADANAFSYTASTPMELATMMNCSVDILEVLISNGGAIYDVLYFSIVHSYLEGLALALARGAKPNKTCERKHDYKTYFGGAVEIWSMTSWAPNRDRAYQVIRRLLEAGADPFLLDCEAKTAIDYARDGQDKQELQLLLEAFGYSSEGRT